MGQSFLTHDEKAPQSAGSPSPDLLQFNGLGSPPSSTSTVGGNHHQISKFFGSLSSVKESGIDSASSTKSITSRSRLQLDQSVEGDSSEEGTRSSSLSRRTEDHHDYSEVYCSLVPTPILPGNVSRLRRKFMEEGGNSKNIRRLPSGGPIENREGVQDSRDTLSDLDCRYISKEAVISLTSPSSRRLNLNRHSLHTFSPCRGSRGSYGSGGASRRSSGGIFINKARTLPPPTPTSYEEKLVGIRSDNDLSDCFRKMGFIGGRNGNESCSATTSETPLVRRRLRTRPYVPQPRSVIIKAGYLPIVQKVDITNPPNFRRSGGGARKTAKMLAASDKAHLLGNQMEEEGDDEDEADGGNSSGPKCSQLHYKEASLKKEHLKLVSASALPPQPPSYLPHFVSKKQQTTFPKKSKAHPKHEQSFTATSPVVAKKTAHTEDMISPVEEEPGSSSSRRGGTTKNPVVMKNAEVNTSAEVLVLPKGTKTSVLLQIADQVDSAQAKALLKRRRKKRNRIHRRVGRIFGRIMIRLVEFF